MILVTGAAGFIGSNFVNSWFIDSEERLISYDNLTYAGNLESIAEIETNERYSFKQVDICDRQALDQVFAQIRMQFQH